MSPKPRLWSFASSPFAGKVRVAMAEKQIPYDLLEIHPIKRPDRLRELNPVARVPVLELEGRLPLRESSVILEYLEEVHPDPALWPEDPALRGWARGWAKYVDDGAAVYFFLGMRKLAFGKADDDPDDVVERLHAKVAGQWPSLEEALDQHDGPWLCGDQFTLADIAGMPLAVRIPQWAAQLEPDAGEFPAVSAWLTALRERPSAAEIDAKGERVEG